MPIQIFKNEFIDSLKRPLIKGIIDEKYYGRGVSFSKADVIQKSNLVCPTAKGLKLAMPSEGKDFQFKNALKVYEHFKNMSVMEATDARIWTYLTHVTFWDYMTKFRPIGDQQENQKVNYILRHYFVDPVNSKNLLLNDISLLWWGTHLTYDPDHKENPYWLTEELFSMLDYTRHLLPGSQGRHREFARAVMQYVAEHKKLFLNYKEAKIRFVMRKCNFTAGYKVFPVLSRKEIIDLISQYENEISQIKEAKQLVTA